jgi:hypothetical protein
MSGKLPIDRVREAEDAPRVYEDHKQRFAEDQARLRELGSSPADLDELRSTPQDDESTEAGRA